jgi:hypothetical protein
MKNLALLVPWLLATSVLADQQHSVKRVHAHYARALEIKPSEPADGTTSTTSSTTSSVHPSVTPAVKHGTPATSNLPGNSTSTTGTKSAPRASVAATSTSSGPGSTASPSSSKLAQSSTSPHDSFYLICIDTLLQSPFRAMADGVMRPQKLKPSLLN